MSFLAVIDATEENPCSPATIVAGLSLLERALRLAVVCGAEHVLLRLPNTDEARTLANNIKSDRPLTIWTEGDPLPDHLPEKAGADAALVLNAYVVFERSLVKSALEHLDSLPAEGLRHNSGHLALVPVDGAHTLKAILQKPHTAIANARPSLSGGWAERIDSKEAAKVAERRLFNGCRKPQDGLVSRYLNRHISISISRILAPTFVKPNHISGVTLFLGFAAAAAAAYGHFQGFLLAGILYQLNSIIDGVDGELARVRYEFSVTGEWLDTISDDLADLLLYLGLGYGAWQTMADAPGPLGAELWLYLGLAAAAGKLASMAVYYYWLIKKGRGDLLAFEWSFKEEAPEKSALARALSLTHYFFRKDFIVFVAMILSFGGFLPHLLFALAPGNILVAVSVVLQQLRNRTSRT